MNSWLLLLKIMCRWVFSVLCTTLDFHVQCGLLDSWSPRKPHKYSLAQGFSMSPQWMFWARSFFAVCNCPACFWTYRSSPSLWTLQKCLWTLQNIPWEMKPLLVKTIASASPWSRRYLIEEQDIFPLHSHEQDLCWFHNILIQRSSIHDVHLTGCHIFTKEIKNWN